jgi:hypothetical protein
MDDSAAWICHSTADIPSDLLRWQIEADKK